MIIKSIKFNNYRCFMDGEIQFSQDAEHSINLVLGDNGGGKTEILFSFWWVLYGFDFAILQGKDDTPYSINSSLFRDIEENQDKRHQSWVELKFEIDKKDYVVRKTETFFFSSRENAVKTNVERVFYSKKENKESELPLRSETEISKEITRLIPKKILYGIIFDGERMKQLSSFDENSVKAIEGVIHDITNIELLENCIATYSELEKINNSAYKRVAKSANEKDLSALLEDVSIAGHNLEEAVNLIDKYVEEERDLGIEATNLNQTLAEYRASKQFAFDREEKQKTKKILEKDKKKQIDDYAEELKNAYLIMAGQLFSDVRNITDNVDVPAGLLVEAVESIIQREYCVCGNPIGEKEILQLKKIIGTLPPDNVNSTLAEMVRQIENRRTDVMTSLQNRRRRIKEKEMDIIKIEAEIDNLSKLIVHSGIDQAEELEKRYLAINIRKNVLIKEIPGLRAQKIELEKKIRDLNGKIESYESNSKEAGQLERERKFITKSLLAFNQIKTKAKDLALTEIDTLFQNAFLNLSEDAAFGRRACIVKHDKKSRYKLVTYYESNYLAGRIQLEEIGKIEKWEEEGLTEEQIREKVILKCKESKSTGQSKIVTLAFVKAILEYSTQTRSTDGIEEKKEYPLLIDAPFTDIFGRNLNNTAAELPKFSSQVILMLAKDSYNTVKKHISNYVSTIHYLEKNIGVSNSSIRREENGDFCK